MTRGLVIGKFYPPHMGHQYLIDTAGKNVDELTVVVCDRKDQKIPGSLRARWIKEVCPNIKVKVVADIMKDDDSKAWAEYTKAILGYVPDKVFTSEDYGDAYAKFLGSKHFIVDKKRVVVPISATKIRQNPLEHWDFIGPGARAHFAKRICVLGAESTGTTTVAKALAEYYRTVWAPEFGRLYWEGKMKLSETNKWRTDEFVFIAKEQNRIEDFLARSCKKILICDTDSFATTLWHERYLGFISPEVDKISAGRNYDIYLLTDTDIPFVQDGTRDGEHIRIEMHQRFEEELKKRGKPYLILSGNREARLKKAIEACDKILNEVKPL